MAFQHVVYLTQGGHLEELYYPLGAMGAQWQSNDLTVQVGGALPAPGPLTSWVDPTDQHAVYVSADGHVHELYYPLGATGLTWQANDLTAQTEAPAAVGRSPLISWADPINQHVIYLSNDGHVRELYYPVGATGLRWQANDITASSGAPLANLSEMAMTGWMDALNQHIVYLTADGHVHELYYPLGAIGLSWQANDLTAQTNAPAAVPGSTLTSWVDPENQHVIYQSADGHLHELYYPLGSSGSQWKTNDLTAQTNAPTAALGSTLTSWADSIYQHIVYCTPDGHIHELFYPLGATGPNWKASDLTAQTGAPAAAGSSALVSWVDRQNQHVAYVSADGHVHELFYPLGTTGPNWKANDLTAQTGAPVAVLHCLTSWVDVAAFAPPVVPADWGGNSNYLVSSNCNPLVDLTVTVKVTQDIVCADGFSLQLNAWSPKGSKTIWQQYVVYLHPDTNEFTYLVDNWQGTNDEIINKQWHFYQATDHKLPAGYTLVIKLSTDAASGSVTGVKYIMLDVAGNTVGEGVQTLVDVESSSGGKVSPTDLAPIVSAQMVLVGYENGAYSQFTSGAGTITYVVARPLSLQLGPQPPCIAVPSFGTEENSNAKYGMTSGANGVFVQPFNLA